MSKFLIEDDYYVVTLDNCYALGKYRGKRIYTDGTFIGIGMVALVSINRFEEDDDEIG